MYFDRMGFNMQSDGIQDRNFVMAQCRNMRISGQQVQVSDGRRPVSGTTMLNDLRNCATSVGYYGKISSKSAKISGTSASFNAGLTNSDVRDKGRWRSPDTALYYRQLSSGHRQMLSTSNTFLMDPEDELEDEEEETEDREPDFPEDLVGQGDITEQFNEQEEHPWSHMIDDMDPVRPRNTGELMMGVPTWNMERND